MHRCKRYKLYSPDAMKEALLSIKFGMTIQQASIKFNIPTRTLYMRFQKINKKDENQKINKKDENQKINKIITELRLRDIEVRSVGSKISTSDEDVVLSLLLYGFEEEMTT